MTRKLLIAALLLCGTAFSVSAKNYTISTPSSQIVLSAEEGHTLYFRYYGVKADAEDVFSSPRAMKEPAFPAYGYNSTKPYACLVKFASGDNFLKLVVDSVARTDSDTASVHSFRLKDVAHSFFVTLNFEAFKDCDVIRTWAEYTNGEKKPVSLQRYMSAVLPVKSEECELLHLNGNHGNECNETVEPLTELIKVIATQEGSRISHHQQAAFMLSTDGHISETAGNTIGGMLAWTGSYRIEFINSREPGDPIRIHAGINPDGADYTLAPGKTLVTPKFILSYSTHGKGEVSRTIHRWARRHVILGGEELRDVLLNSWEGVHMAIRENDMHEMMDDISRFGGELFVMDDGWFGVKYPRDNSSNGLGDWTTDLRKLPNGISGLTAYAASKGIKFGIWIEPEMVNYRSELYEKHPDWVLRPRNFDPKYGRGQTQLLLDLTNPKVQDFVFSVVDNILTANPEIPYIKWDHNMSIENPCSPYLPEAVQSNLQVEYQLGLEKILKRVREKYPKTVIQLCSSGGERVNYGFMPYFQEVWTSDQTDPLHRIFIQWGSLDFYPANILGAHVCAHTSKYSQRPTPIKFRFDVASMCRLGMEMVPSEMNPAEQEYAKRAIEAYKHLRPVIQQGDLYKLISPYEGSGNYASLMYVSEKKDRAVLFAYRTTFVRHQADKIIKLQGLDPDRKYLIRDAVPEHADRPFAIDGKKVSGRYLMEEGIVIREFSKNYSMKNLDDVREMNDYRSVILELIAQ